MMDMTVPLQAKGSAIEPIIDSLLDKVTDVPQLTISTLMEEIFNLLNQPVIQQNEEAKSLLKNRLTHILAKNPEELLESKEKKIYNCISHGLIDRQGRVNKVCLDILKEIDLEKPLSTEKQSLQLELQEMRKQLTTCNEKQERYLIELNILKKLTLFTNTFGKDEWNFYFGDVGAVPPLPNNIEDILARRCLVTGKGEDLVKNTHLLVLIPATLNGQPLNFRNMLNLAENPRNGAALGEGNMDIWRNGELKWNDPNNVSRWVLMTKKVLLESRNQTFEGFDNLIRSLNERTTMQYQIPSILEATVCLLASYVINPHDSSFHSSYTYCQEEGTVAEDRNGMRDFKPAVGFNPKFTTARTLSELPSNIRGIAPLIRL
jgi:hypothetical protein